MSQLWSKVGKVVGAFFLFGGGTLSIALVTAILTSQATGGFLAVLATFLILFGLAPASLGAWLLHASARLKRQALRERFFQVLRVSQGRVSVLDFAAAARLEPAMARQYLDHWAKEFSATFDVNDEGNIYYVFTKETLLLPEAVSFGLWSQTIRQWLQSTV
ncbi:hypothetical protein [Stenomitos frigidus]|uniref:Uncharacterized protein n=1 Tax=Stenomitos frigidus ULC18 TaxID=2107698 RepID=A0A2T1DXF3_9CYAN|nr:hypothetical protein [Stenomitos frigidus]PSB25054.1 hypothetical protein C7B82_24590 [Stenomitos frigidus ULC18]